VENKEAKAHDAELLCASDVRPTLYSRNGALKRDRCYP
jgi:hypothetical protein